MPSSDILLEKIGLLFKEIEKMSQPDKIRTVERFVRAQIKLQETPHVVDYQSLFQMASFAKSAARDLPTNTSMNGHLLHHDPEMFKMFCYFEAVYRYLRANQLTPYLIEIKTDRNP